MDVIAEWIALSFVEVLAAMKASVAEQAASPEAYLQDQARFNALAATQFVQSNIAKFLEMSRKQSKVFEPNVVDIIVDELY